MNFDKIKSTVKLYKRDYRLSVAPYFDDYFSTQSRIYYKLDYINETSPFIIVQPTFLVL